jgi:hypothetical protein
VLCPYDTVIEDSISVLFAAGKFVEAVAAGAEFALAAQFLPDLAGKLARRGYGKYAGMAAGKTAFAKAGIVVKGGEFEAFLECLEGALESFGGYGRNRLFRIFHEIFSFKVKATAHSCIIVQGDKCAKKLCRPLRGLIYCKRLRPGPHGPGY